MKKTVFGLYSIRWRKAKSVFKWTPPFLAASDGVALNALITMSAECPDLQNKYLCKVGTFDPFTGVVKGCKPVVVNKTKENNDEVSHAV